MSEIIPRWEWRTFGEDLGSAALRLASRQPTEIQESEEVYLISGLCDVSVKIRNGQLEVKRLEQTDSNGLEQWRPVLKVGFPLPAETAARIFEILCLPAPALLRTSYGQGELANELAAQEPRLRTIYVHKTRAHYRIGDRLAELTDVVVEGRRVRTLALELEDPAMVIAAQRNLGLSYVPNVSYPRALTTLVGMTCRVAPKCKGTAQTAKASAMPASPGSIARSVMGQTETS